MIVCFIFLGSQKTPSEERDISPASMNINFCPLQYKHKSLSVSCPFCHSNRCRKHGYYQRKGFHRKNSCIVIPMEIPRFRCTNPQCKHRTFSLLPQMVLRYCRFFWPCLQMIWSLIARGFRPYYIARIWEVDRAVIVRAVTLQSTLQSFVEKLHQEIYDGTVNHSGMTLTLMVKFVILKIGFSVLANHWYCHRYPRRYFTF